jgi:hypothetical protein
MLTVVEIIHTTNIKISYVTFTDGTVRPSDFMQSNHPQQVERALLQLSLCLCRRLLLDLPRLNGDLCDCRDIYRSTGTDDEVAKAEIPRT